MTLWWPALGLVILIIFRQRILNDLRLFKADRKQWAYHKWKEWGEPFVVAAILAIVIRTFFLGPYKIPTGSMKPTFMEQDRIFVDKISYRFNPPQRGDIVVFKYPMDHKKDFVKRLVGLPGEQLQIVEGKLILNGAVLEESPFSNFYYYNHEDWKYGEEGLTIRIPKEHYFVLGDNSSQSSDSRKWGFVPAKNMVGKAFFIWWPPKRIKLAH